MSRTSSANSGDRLFADVEELCLSGTSSESRFRASECSPRSPLVLSAINQSCWSDIQNAERTAGALTAGAKRSCDIQIWDTHVASDLQMHKSKRRLARGQYKLSTGAAYGTTRTVLVCITATAIELCPRTYKLKELSTYVALCTVCHVYYIILFRDDHAVVKELINAVQQGQHHARLNCNICSVLHGVMAGQIICAYTFRSYCLAKMGNRTRIVGAG